LNQSKPFTLNNDCPMHGRVEWKQGETFTRITHRSSVQPVHAPVKRAMTDGDFRPRSTRGGVLGDDVLQSVDDDCVQRLSQRLGQAA